MAGVVKGVCRLIVPAAQAKPTPAIGQALGPLGLNMMEFCKAFNDQTRNYVDNIPMRVKLTAFEDRTFEFKVSSPATSWFLKKIAGVEKGTSQPGRSYVGEVSLGEIYEVAKIKQKDSSLQHHTLEGITKQIIGSANALGLRVVD